MGSQVMINKGDVLNVVLSSETKDGNITKTVISMSYDDILSKIQKKKITRKSKSRGRLFSRQAGLVYHALVKGVWANGKTVDSEKAVEKLIILARNLSASEIRDITDTGITHLHKITTIYTGEGSNYLSKVIWLKDTLTPS